MTNTSQRFILAAIVIAGALGIGAVLWTDPEAPVDAQARQAAEGQGAHDDHTDGDRDAKDGTHDAKKGAHDAKKGAHDANTNARDTTEGDHEAQTGTHGAKEGHHDAKEGAHGAKAGEHDAHEEERHVALSAAQQQAAGIGVLAAGPESLQSAASYPGEIRFNDDRTAHVVPRIGGVAEAVRVQLGEAVRQGQVLAVIASPALAEQRSELLTAERRRAAARTTFEREKKLWLDRISAEQDYLQAQTTLQEADIAVQNAAQKLAAVGATPSSSALNRFEIRAPFAGTVVEKHLSLGEAVAENASIFTVSDLASVWAEFAVAPKDLAKVRVGQQVVVSSTAFESRVEGRVSYVGALLGEQTRTAKARVTLNNPQGAWRPGLFVTVAVMGASEPVALAVSADALQTIDEQPMLFVAVADGFEARPVKVGRSDGTTVEILDGLQAGERYAAANAFVLKSELGKAGADHSH